METLTQIVAQGIMLGGIYALIALAMTIVYSVTHQLNFAHGDLNSIAMYLALFASVTLGMDPYVSVLIIAPLMFLFGVVLFTLVFYPMIKAPLLVVIQVTLALSFIIQSAIHLAFTSNFLTVQSVLSGKTFRFAGASLALTSLLPFFVAILLATISYYVIRYTDFGRQVRAVAEDADAASLSGIKVRRIQVLVFACAVGILGIVGPLVAPVFVLQPTFGLHLSLISFIVFILGGSTNYLGTFVAGLIIGISESLASLYMRPPELAATVPYLIFIAFLLFRPEGLLRK